MDQIWAGRTQENIGKIITSEHRCNAKLRAYKWEKQI